MRLLELALGALVVLAAMMRRRPAQRPPPGVDADDLAAGYERSDASVGAIVLAGIGLLLALGIILVAVSWLGATVTGRPVAIGPPVDLIDRQAGAPRPPPPRLEVAEDAQLSVYRAESQQRLQSYAWVDRGSGVVSIPIERAKDLLVERGLPARASVAASDDARRLPSRASSGRVAETVWP